MNQVQSLALEDTMTVDDLVFEPHELNGIKGYTAHIAFVNYPNGYGVSVCKGTYWDIPDQEYDVAGLVNGEFLEELAVGSNLPEYFRAEERADENRVNEILAEVEALPPLI